MIPTLGRSNKQISFDNLAKFLQDKTTLVVQPHEKDLYPNYPTLVLPEDNIGISRTRKFIYDYCHGDIFAMMDDDIKVQRRRKDARPLKVDPTIDEWKQLIDTHLEWLDNGFSFTSLMQGSAPPRKKDIQDNTAVYGFVFYGKDIPKSDELIWNHDLLAEDVNLHLQLLLKGYKNRVSLNYCCEQKSYAEGGCSSLRTLEMMDKSHKYLIEQYPEVVKWDCSKGKQQYSANKKSPGWKKINIFWNRASKLGDK